MGAWFDLRRFPFVQRFLSLSLSLAILELADIKNKEPFANTVQNQTQKPSRRWISLHSLSSIMMMT